MSAAGAAGRRACHRARAHGTVAAAPFRFLCPEDIAWRAVKLGILLIRDIPNVRKL